MDARRACIKIKSIAKILEKFKKKKKYISTVNIIMKNIPADDVYQIK